MEEFLMKPNVDFAFKEIMMDEMARIGFLSAVLGIRPEDIKETGILNSSLRKAHEDDGPENLDMRISMNHDTEIEIEINPPERTAWACNPLFYLSKMFTEQMKPEDKYIEFKTFKKCVIISILNFELFPETEKFDSCFHIGEDKRKFIYTDKMEFHVLELPKLPKEWKDDSSDILLWGKFINAEHKNEFDMLAEKNPYIKSAYSRLRSISQDAQKRLEYEARQKAILAYHQSVLEAEEHGRAEAAGKLFR